MQQREAPIQCNNYLGYPLLSFLITRSGFFVLVCLPFFLFLDCKHREPMTPRSYSLVMDMENGYGRSNDDEDDSKYRRPIHVIRWKRYSRGFYLAGFVVCLVVVLFILMLRVANGTDMDSTASSSVTGDETYKLMVVADLDTNSREKDDKKGKWKTILKKAELRRKEDGKFSVHWLEDQEVFTKFSEAGRGMELSALLEFNNRLYSFDDRTGIVYEMVKGNKAIPRFILMEGNGDTEKGQKSEWATVKDGKMIVGSFGKEYTNPDGSIRNTNNMWVSTIDSNGHVEHVDWMENYNRLRKAVGCSYPGYMIHEAIAWSQHMKKWVVLPRRVSNQPYDEVEDERRGSNLVLLVSENFKKIEVRRITPITPTRGFSDFKFLPNSHDQIIVALKSEESEKLQTQNSYITVFDLNGTVLMDETEIPGKHKFEGLEFFFFYAGLFHSPVLNRSAPQFPPNSANSGYLTIIVP